MFGCKDDHFHSGCFHGFAPLVGIKVLQVEDLRIFHAVPPLLPGECVRTKVDKSDVFVLQCGQLVGSRNHMRCLLNNHFMAIAGFDLDRVLESYSFILPVYRNGKERCPQ